MKISSEELIITLLIFTVLGCMFLTVPITQSSAQEDDSGQTADFTEFWTDGPGDANKSFNKDGTGTYLGLTAPEYFKLWGYDDDETGSVSSGGTIGTDYSQNVETTQSDNPGQATRLNLSELTGYYRVMDATYKNPPQTAAQWNRRSSQGLNDRLNGQVHNSIYPRDGNVNPTGTGRLAGAYVEFFSISPSTTVHYTDSKTITYMRESGSVITAADYLVKNLQTEINGDVKYTYNLQSHGVDWLRLTTKDNCPEGASCEMKKVSGKQSKVIDYSNLEENLNESQTNTLYLKGRIYADVQVTKYTYDPCSEGETDCGWQKSGQWIDTDEIIVQDSKKIAFQDLNVTVHAAKVKSFNKDKTVLHIENRGSNVSSYWGYADPDGNAIVRTNWKYYTARDRNWDFLLRSKRNGNVDSTETKYRPVNVHAYPTTEGSISFDQDWNRTEQSKIIEELGSNISTPNQPDDTMLDWIQKGNYTPANELLVEFKKGSVNPSSSFEVYGLVEGTSISVKPKTVYEIRGVNLKYKVLNVLNETAARIQVTAVDEKTGEPIQTSKLNDYLRINGVSGYQTNANGKVETVVVVNSQQQGSVEIKYVAGRWWIKDETGPAYQTQVVYADIFRDGLIGILNFVVFLLKLAVIALTPIWILNIVMASMGIDTWSTVKEIANKNNPFK